MAQISTLLLQAASGSLPPWFPPAGGSAVPDDAAPFGQGLGRPFDCAGAEAMERAIRTARDAKVPAAHATAEAVERAIRSRAVKARDIRKQADQAAASVQRVLASPDMRRTFLGTHRPACIAAVVVVALLGGGGFLFARHQATIGAKAQIDAFLAQAGLASSVTYAAVSASPFGSATMSGVVVQGPGQGVVTRIDALTISDIETSGDTLTQAKVAAESFELPILALARQYRGEPIARQVLGLGYTTLRGNLSVAVRFDAQSKTVSFAAKGDIKDLGSIDTTLRFGGLTTSDASTLAAIANTARRPNPMQSVATGMVGMQIAMQVSLAAADLTIGNSGIFQRSRQITDASLPPDGPTLSAHPGAGMEQALLRAGMPETDARAAGDAFGAWTSKGGTLRITTHIDQPIPLIQPQGVLGMPTFAFTDPADFLAVTKATVSD